MGVPIDPRDRLGRHVTGPCQDQEQDWDSRLSIELGSEEGLQGFLDDSFRLLIAPLQRVHETAQGLPELFLPPATFRNALSSGGSHGSPPPGPVGQGPRLLPLDHPKQAEMPENLWTQGRSLRALGDMENADMFRRRGADPRPELLGAGPTGAGPLSSRRRSFSTPGVCRTTSSVPSPRPRSRNRHRGACTRSTSRARSPRPWAWRIPARRRPTPRSSRPCRIQTCRSAPRMAVGK